MPVSRAVPTLAAAMLAALSIPVQAAAQDLPAPAGPTALDAAPPAAARAADPDLAFTLRGGAAVAPEYIGSGDYQLGPDLGFTVNYLQLGRFGSFGSVDPRAALPTGFGLRGSFRYIGERTQDEAPDLAGLEDIDATVELGVGLVYRQPRFEAFASVRRGFGGHDSVVGEIGADLISRPTDRLTLRAGPRVFFGDDDYASTYFGVSPEEAAASGLDAYDADGGALSAGIELGASYRIDDRWGVEGAVTWRRLDGDAEDSPITELGDRDQYRLRLGVTRRFTLEF